MKVITPSYKILSYPEDVVGKIERSARLCYQSTDLIGPGSGARLVKSLMRRGHWAMIEFGGVIVVRFKSNRGFTHEMVRHRLASLAQESTRYCNYSKGKFGSEITVCSLEDIFNLRSFSSEVDKVKAQDIYRGWTQRIFDAWIYCETVYLDLITLGCPPELAREVLPIGLKAEIDVQANIREWRHIFKLRCSKKAHPRMRELMIPLLHDVAKLCPIIFDDLAEEYPMPSSEEN